jgi:hypothetical protein
MKKFTGYFDFLWNNHLFFRFCLILPFFLKNNGVFKKSYCC